MTSEKLRLVPLAVLLAVAGACSGAAAEEPEPATTSTTGWYRPTECGMGPAYLERLQRDAALEGGYDALMAELERQAEVLQRCP